MRLHFEKQRSQFCAVHAVNNLLQSKAASKESFDSIARVLASKYGIRTTELYDRHHGFYDISVIIYFLNRHLNARIDYSCEIPTTPSSFIGIIANLNGSHYVAIRKLGRSWIMFDSLSDRQQVIDLERFARNAPIKGAILISPI